MPPGLREPQHRVRHVRRHGRRSFGLDELRSAALRWNDEVHFEALPVAEVVELAPPTQVALRLDDLGGDEALEQRAAKRGLCEFCFRVDAEQMARQARVRDVYLWRLDEPLAKIREVGRYDQDLY